MRVTKHTLSRYFTFNVEYLSSLIILTVDAGKKVVRFIDKMQRICVARGVFNLTAYEGNMVAT